MKYLDLVILAGGKGTRIRNYTKNNPKPLAKIADYVFLDLLLGNVSKYHFRKIFILAGYKGDKIYKKYHNKNINFINIQCFIEKKPLGTGGALKLIKKKLTNNFFVINGDTIADFDFYEMIKLKKRNSAVLASTKSSFSSEGNKIRNLTFDSKKLLKINHSKQKNFKSAGVYLFSKSNLNVTSKNKFSLEDNIILPLIKKNKVHAYSKNFFFYDIGTKNDFLNAKKKLIKYLRKTAIFFDRDNTINYDEGYTYKYKNFKFINNAIKALKYISKKNTYIFIVTNQAGIAKGYFSEHDFISLHVRLKKEFIKKKIFINEVKYCPYHPKAKYKKYRKKTSLRKPGNLMISQIIENWVVNKKKSLMIGDKISDQECAKKSNLNFQFVKKDLFKQIKNIKLD